MSQGLWWTLEASLATKKLGLLLQWCIQTIPLYFTSLTRRERCFQCLQLCLAVPAILNILQLSITHTQQFASSHTLFSSRYWLLFTWQEILELQLKTNWIASGWTVSIPHCRNYVLGVLHLLMAVLALRWWKLFNKSTGTSFTGCKARLPQPWASSPKDRCWGSLKLWLACPVTSGPCLRGGTHTVLTCLCDSSLKAQIRAEHKVQAQPPPPPPGDRAVVGTGCY